MGHAAVAPIGENIAPVADDDVVLVNFLVRDRGGQTEAGQLLTLGRQAWTQFDQTPIFVMPAIDNTKFSVSSKVHRGCTKLPARSGAPAHFIHAPPTRSTAAAQDFVPSPAEQAFGPGCAT
jgi:hypothetical protein